MNGRMPEVGLPSLADPGICPWVMAVATARYAAPEPASPPQSQKPATVAAKVIPGAGAEGQSYVGEAKCLECHSEQLKGYEGSPHHPSPIRVRPSPSRAAKAAMVPEQTRRRSGYVSREGSPTTPATRSQRHVHHVP